MFQAWLRGGTGPVTAADMGQLHGSSWPSLPMVGRQIDLLPGIHTLGCVVQTACHFHYDKRTSRIYSTWIKPLAHTAIGACQKIGERLCRNHVEQNFPPHTSDSIESRDEPLRHAAQAQSCSISQ
jgi:hypothetical protein